MMRLVLSASVLMLLLFPGQGSSAIYKWVDENGRITFKDTPPPEGVTAEVVVPRDNSYRNEGGAAAPNEGVRDYPKVEIYMTKWCPTCKVALEYLNTNGIRYTKYDIDEDRAANERLSSTYHQKGIPFTVIGNERILGFSRQRFDSALGINPSRR